MDGASVWFVVRKTFWDFYDNLGVLIVGNIAFLLISLFVLPAPFFLIGMFLFTRNAALRKPLAVSDIFKSIKTLDRKRFFLTGLFVLVFFCFPFVNLFFTNVVTQNSAAVLFKGMSLFVLVLVSLVSLYFLPLVAAGNELRKSIAYSLFFIRANILYTVLNAFVILCISAFFTISGIGILLFLFTFLSLYLNNIFIYIFDLYRKETTLNYKFYNDRSLKEIFLFWRY